MTYFRCCWLPQFICRDERGKREKIRGIGSKNRKLRGKIKNRKIKEKTTKTEKLCSMNFLQYGFSVFKKERAVIPLHRKGINATNLFFGWCVIS